MAPNTKKSLVPFSPVKSMEKCQTKKIKEILVDGFYYDVTDWARRHPGGRIIEFYTENCEDASAAVQQFHFRSNTKVRAIMSSLKRRPAETSMIRSELDTERLKRNEALTKDFNELFSQLVNEGFFEPSVRHIVYRLVELLTFVSVGVYLCQNDSYILKGIGIVLCAIFFGRVGWFEHEAGHHSFSGNPHVDRWLQMVVIGIGTGMSSSYWSLQHNRHHAMPQRLERDVDLDTMPLIAFNSKVVKNLKIDKPNFFIQNQAILFLAIDTFLVAFIWKFILHPRYVFRKRKFGQIFFMSLHYLIAYQMGLWPYLMAVWLASVYMFGNFSLSHTHLPVTQDPCHWVEYGLLHTMDIEPSWLIDWWMGYLNCQIEHHLFPTMPQYRNRLIKDRVKALANRHNIPYQSSSYWSAVIRTFKNLHNVSKELTPENGEKNSKTSLKDGWRNDKNQNFQKTIKYSRY